MGHPNRPSRRHPHQHRGVAVADSRGVQRRSGANNRSRHPVRREGSHGMSRVAKVVITGPASRVEVDGLTLQTIVAGERELNLVNVGPPGPPGAAATVHLLGTLDNPSELPTPGSVGDGWMIDGDVWVWTAEGEWINAGPIRGPQGPPGPTEPYVRLGSNLGSPRHLGQLPVAPGGLSADDILHIGRAISSGNPAAGVNSYGGTTAELLQFIASNMATIALPVASYD